MSFIKSKHSGWTWELRRTPFGGGGGSFDPISAISDAVSSVSNTVSQGFSDVGLGGSLNNYIVPAIALGAAAFTGGASLALDAGLVASADATAVGMGFSSAAEAISAGAITAEGLGLPAAATIADLGAVAGTASEGFVSSGLGAGVAGGVDAGGVATGATAAGNATGGVAVDAAGLPITDTSGVAAGTTGGTVSPAGTYGAGSASVTDYSTAASASTQASADQAAAASAGYTPMQVAQAAKQGITVAKLLQGAGTALGIIPAATNLFKGGLTGGGATSSTDPYAQYRPQAAQQLNTLMNQPSAALSQPGYQQQLQQGMQQAQRGAAATGQLQSGAEMNALQQQGQNTFGSYYNTLVGNLMQMSGAAQNPASGQVAAQQIAASKQNVQNQQLGTITSGLGSIASLYGGSSPSSTNTAYDSGLGGYTASQISQGALNPVSAADQASYMALQQ